MLIEIVFSILAGAGANGIAQAVKLAQLWLAIRRKLKEAEEDRFQKVLASDSLIELGGYLDSRIGSFLVVEYAQNAEVKARVNTFLARLEEFVGRTEEVPGPVKAPDLPEAALRDIKDTELEGVEKRLQEGRPWDALAVMRRVIERRLLRIARSHEIEVPKKASAGRLLEMLRREHLLSADTIASLRYAIDVANRGVHGLEVSEQEAYEALGNASSALSAIEANR